MYEIELSNDNGTTWQKVHETNALSDRRVKACTFSRGVSAIQAADFQLLATNPTYTDYHERTTLVRIRNTKNGSLAFDGFVAKVYSDGMDSSGVVQKSVSCDGCLAWLNDTIQMYRKFDNIPLGEVLFGNVQGRPVGLLVEHNAHVPEHERIYQGTIECTGNFSFECKYESTLECIKKNILDALQDAEISVSRDGQGRLILNITNGANATKLNTPVQLADNMVSMALETDASNIVTRLIPLGAYIETEQQVSGKTKKVRTNQRVDISTAADYSQDGVTHSAGSVYLDDAAAQSQYGVIVGTVVFDDATDVSQIMTQGADYLRNNNRIKKSYKAEVLDLSTIGLADDELKEGYVYRFVNRMIPIDEDLRIQKITVDIFAAHKPTIEIGDKTEKITDVGAKQQKLIEYELPEKQAEFLDAAQATATAMMQNATQGYIYIDEDLGEFLIMNTPDKATANKLWRWNSAGFGYAETEAGISAYDHGVYKIAMTSDHALTSDFVMAASVTAQNLTITGGKINMESSRSDVDVILLRYDGQSAQTGTVYHGYTQVTPWVFRAGETFQKNNRTEMQWDGLRGYYDSANDRKAFQIDSESGTFWIWGNGTSSKKSTLSSGRLNLYDDGDTYNKVLVDCAGIYGFYGSNNSEIAFTLNSETGNIWSKGTIAADSTISANSMTVNNTITFYGSPNVALDAASVKYIFDKLSDHEQRINALENA